MTSKIGISIIVPAKNSSKNLEKLLLSLINSTYKNFEVIVNDDISSTDNSKSIVDMFNSYYKTTYIKKNLSMAQGRKVAATYASGNILLHLDTDMTISNNLLSEIARKLNNQYDALVIPEISIGESYWAKVKALEKKMYTGIENLESVRAIKINVYTKVEGHNEKMVFSEDKDLDLRVRRAGYKIGRTVSHLNHHEGEIKLRNTLNKKMRYAETANIFAQEHKKAYRWQLNILHRYILYLRNIKYFFSTPLLYVSLYILKTLEYTFSFIGLIGNYLKIRKF